MASIRSEDSGLGRSNNKHVDRRISQVSFSQASEGLAIGRVVSMMSESPGNTTFNNNNINANMAASIQNNNFGYSSNDAGAGSSPIRSRRSVWREVIAGVRTNRELLVDSFIRTAIPAHNTIVIARNTDMMHDSEDKSVQDRDDYPHWIPAFFANPEARLKPQRVITANRPNGMRNRALVSMAMALSALAIEMNESFADVALPNALQTNSHSNSDELPASPNASCVPREQHPTAGPTRNLAPITVEDVCLNGKVPLDMLQQPMLTLFEVQDILQRCVSTSSILAGKFEVKIAPASVLLVDTEDDWGTNFEIAPRRLAYKASELEEALSDVLRRRGVALVFFDKKALIEGMKQDDVGGEDEDDEQHAKLQAMLNAPLNEEGSVSHNTNDINALTNDPHGLSANAGSLFNGSFTGIGGGRGAPIAMQALRTRRTDIREADCGFVLGPTRSAEEGVALAVTSWNRERDELELFYTEVTAAALLDAMAMRSANTGRPRGFVALMPLHDLSIRMPSIPPVSAVAASSSSNSNTAPATPENRPHSAPRVHGGHSPAGSRSPQEGQIVNQSVLGVNGPAISALEIVASNAVTLDCVFPTFSDLAQYHCDEIEQAGETSNTTTKSSSKRIPLGHIDNSIATHVTACAIGAAAVTGTLSYGLPINDIINHVNLSDDHMSSESDNTLHVHEVFSYMLQYSYKNPSAHLDVEWCPVVQLIHRANAASTVSIEQLGDTLTRVRDDSLKVQPHMPLDVCMIVKVRIDIAVGTHGNSMNGSGSGTRWLVVVGFNEDSNVVTVLDPAPKRFGLFWSVSVEQLHQALTGHGYIILNNKQCNRRTAADYIVSRPETNQIVLQAGISYDSPDGVLPPHSQLPPKPIPRCPLSLAACAISRISGRNISFSQFLRELPTPAPYGFTEDISLAHFAHVLRTYCHEKSLPVKMTLCHLSVDAKGARAVDEQQFSDQLRSAAASPNHAVIVNYGVTAFTSTCRSDRGTGSFAILLGFIPQDGRINRYDRVLLQDCSDFISQQVFSVEVNELYRACCDVCSVSRRTMGFIDLRYVESGEESSVSPVLSLGSVGSSSDLSRDARRHGSGVSLNREQNVSIALEGTLATSNWDAVAVSNHPSLPRHIFKSPAIPILTAVASALVSLGVNCGETDLIAASFYDTASHTPNEHLPTVLQAKPPSLQVSAQMTQTFLESTTKNKKDRIKLLSSAAHETNFLSAVEALKKYPHAVRIVLQYDCRAVHSTIRKFVSAGVVSAVKGSGERALIRVLEAEIASFLDVWEARAGALNSIFEEQQDENHTLCGILVLYKGSMLSDEEAIKIFNQQQVSEHRPPALSKRSVENDDDDNHDHHQAGHVNRRPTPPPTTLVSSPPASPMLNRTAPAHASTGSIATGGAILGAGVRSRTLPYSLSSNTSANVKKTF